MRRPLTGLAAAAILMLALASGDPSWAQGAAPSSPVRPAGLARLSGVGHLPVSLPFTMSPSGPLFDLPVLAAYLGVELRVGPLGASHRLIFEDKQVIVGPDRAEMVTVTPDGSRQEQITVFSQAPVQAVGVTAEGEAVGGLRVPLDFLELALGDELDVDFEWDAERLELHVARREIRTLDVAIDVIHQYTSTVEIRFTAGLGENEAPRYRVERRDGTLDIRLVGARIRLPVERARTESPLVRGIQVVPEGIRIELADGAAAAEPRLLRSPETRLIVEVFQQTAAPPSEERIPTTRDDVAGVRTIVIDPGHGGVETGAVGPGGTAEKDLTLLVARALKRQIERRLPVKVVLTRSTDVDLPLETRTAIANQNKADLFISVHFNSSFGPKVQGAETYFLSRQASDQLAAEVAAAENAVAVDDEDPEAGLQLILWDLAQSFHLAESQRFASLVQEELNAALALRDRGVRQAPFRVLMGAQMPAVLVELGFLNDPDEERKLESPVYRADLVDALLRAIVRFRTQAAERGDEDAGDAQ